MARAAVIVLALANLGYFAWSTGALAVFDLVPRRLTATEPHRLARQIQPGWLRIVTEETPPALPLPVPASPQDASPAEPPAALPSASASAPAVASPSGAPAADATPGTSPQDR